MARLTIQRAPFGKINTQLNRRAELSAVKEKLEGMKVTLSPANDAILWSPSPILCKALAEILEREQTFSRKPESIAYALVETNISRLRKYAEAGDMG